MRLRSVAERLLGAVAAGAGLQAAKDLLCATQQSRTRGSSQAGGPGPRLSPGGGFAGVGFDQMIDEGFDTPDPRSSVR